MRVEAPRLSEQPVLPSFPTVTSLPSKDKEHPPHLSGDAEGKGPPMKKRKRFSLAWLALLALAGGVELLIVDGTLSGGTPLSRVASSVRETLDQTPTPANAASQQMYIWKDASGVTHISETPPPKPPAGKVEEYQFSPQPPAAQPEPVAPLDIPSPEHQPSAAELEKAAAEARKRLQQQVEQLQKERGQLEKQLYRARATGDGYAQIRFRTLLNRTERRWKSSSPNSDICHAATLPQRIYPD